MREAVNVTQSAQTLFLRGRDAALRAPAKDKDHLLRVKMMPCCVCRKPGPSDPHHLFGSVHGMKSSDYGAIPLCREHHEEVTNNPKHNWELLPNLIATLMEIMEDVKRDQHPF